MAPPQGKPPPRPRRKGTTLSATSDLPARFATAGEQFAQLGSPFNQLVCNAIASKPLPPGPVRRALEVSDPSPDSGLTVVVRLVHALHELALNGKEPALTELYPTNDPAAPYRPPTKDRLGQAIRHALAEHKLFFLGRLQSEGLPDELLFQSLVVPALLAAVQAAGMNEIVLTVINAGTGLVMLPDRYQLTDMTDKASVSIGSGELGIPVQWTGNNPGNNKIHIRERAGWATRALDPASRELQQQVVSVCPPEHHQRMATIRAALRLTAGARIHTDRGNPVQWLNTRLAQHWTGAVHCIVELPAKEKPTFDPARALAQKNATADAPVCWVSVEIPDQAPLSYPLSSEYQVRLDCWPVNSSARVASLRMPGMQITWHGSDAKQKKGGS